MKQQIENLIKEILKNLGIGDDVSFNIEHPDDLKNGDYSTNVAMVYFRDKSKFFNEANEVEIQDGKFSRSHIDNFGIVKDKKIYKNPREYAESIKLELEKIVPKEILKVEVAGPGFINFYLSKEFFKGSIEEILNKGDNWGKNEKLKGKKVMVEYTDPNPFKPFHIGHLMTNAIGESVSRIVEFSGAETIRANYQGDVGLHIAKAIYALIKFGMPDESRSISEQAKYIGECYSRGSNLYDTDENIKKEIDEINKKIYKKSSEDEIIWNIYLKGMEITMAAFEEIYKILGTKFNEDCYFLESMMMHLGERIVRDNLGKIFSESDGAIVFKAEEYDNKLHTRVFITSQGLPTYETKEIGLTITKFEKKNPDISVVVTATEQAEYMKVVQKAISLMHPELESRMKHITHGMMKLSTGKMSSRKGNIITGEFLITDSIMMVREKMMISNPKHDKTRINEELNKRYDDVEKITKQVGVAALKYSILKSSIGSDIIYDQEKSISFEGDSGPYLQYTAVRANSIIKKAENFDLENKNETPEEITDLEKKLYQFSEVVEYSYDLLESHHITTYLTKLASEFNSFYGNTQILVEENKYMAYHLNLVKAFYQTMKNGLWLLGIEIPERM